MAPQNGISNQIVGKLRKSLKNNDLINCPLCSSVFDDPVVLNVSISYEFLKDLIFRVVLIDFALDV
jgi:hypothetical protein